MSLSVQARGELAAEDVAVLRLSALRGLFSAVIEEPVTFVNARPSPKNAESSPRSALPPKAPTTAAWSTCGQWPPTARWSTSRARCRPQLVQKIVQINGRNFDLRAEGINLIINYIDRPGALGKIGTLLGAAGSTSTPHSCRRTPRVPVRPSCCASTATCPRMCGRHQRGRRRQQARSG
ncbi:D-3-phosphoglycerate dehydrogenase domain protein [Mycobacterium xenopi 4042]|uniref:D-3-phosphoglycerate dehydrogenase domain protein n=1 Tax=Mycobacterium xenopi 4042 TaxID=1299334 RepID=X7Z5Y6_MYCXE|nr:D-3-phosphoglycerate dehydrogenase domain protein [Mycobacterium xenopi 4042]